MSGQQASQAQHHLYAMLLKLRPQAAGDLLPNAGHLAHAALLHWFAQVDPALSARLHVPNAARPFTCSSLWFPNEREVALAQRENRRLPIFPGQVYWLRLTLLRDELFETLTTRFFQPRERSIGANGQPRPDLPLIRLGGVVFEVSELVVLPPEQAGQQPHAVSWAGYTTYERLVEQARSLDPSSPAAQQIGLEFRSPTAFSDGEVAWGKRMHLFPDPDRVFDRLARVWNEWAPAPLALDATAIQAYAHDWVAVASHVLQTRLFHFDRYSQVGFTGECTYRLMEIKTIHTPSQSARETSAVGAGLTATQALHLLAEFAFYSGVGQKTAMGMGQARPLRSTAGQPAPTRLPAQQEGKRETRLPAPASDGEVSRAD